MELAKKGRFITDVYGSAPALGAEGLLKRWTEDVTYKWLLSWADQIKKKGENALQTLEQILSIFHRDAQGNPVIGAWMLRRCLVNTGQTIFNAMKNKTHPKRDLIPVSMRLVEPHFIHLYNGQLIEMPHGIQTYTVTVGTGKNARSFFKAYEYIKAGTTFDAVMTWDDELINEEHIEKLTQKAGSVGVGAFRERFGKFEWV